MGSSLTVTSPACARPKPCTDSATTDLGSLMSFFMAVLLAVLLKDVLPTLLPGSQLAVGSSGPGFSVPLHVTGPGCSKGTAPNGCPFAEAPHIPAAKSLSINSNNAKRGLPYSRRGCLLLAARGCGSSGCCPRCSA